MRVFGFTHPIIIDRAGGIIAGHGRDDAAKLLKMDRVQQSAWRIYPRDRIQTYVIADNRLAEDAGWDKDILRIELQNLIFDDQINISVISFEVAEMI